MGAKGDANRSVRFTKKRIRGAVIDLMEDKPYKSVTVGEITERANVSRATFYTHYHDIYELVDSIEDDLIKEISGTLHRLDMHEYVEGHFPLMTTVYRFMQDNKKVFCALLGPNGDMSFQTRLSQVLTDCAYDLWGDIAPDKECFRLSTSFMVSGIIGMFMTDMAGAQGAPAEKMGYVSGEYLAFSKTLNGIT
jgi:AcrR family transcriptional regulator